jgi:uncharacterized membrane protein HdeD (DUF308 family)
MLELSRTWWMLAVRGVAAVIFGLLALIWPQITLLALVLVFGAYALVDGAFSLVAAARGRELAGGSRGWLILEGLLGVAAGIVAIVVFGLILIIWPGSGAIGLVWLIGIYAIAFGIVLLGLALRLRGLGRRLATPA